MQRARRRAQAAKRRPERMAYFDIASAPEGAEKEVAERLGFRRIYSLGSDVELLDDAASKQDGTKKIIAGRNADTLAKGIRRNDVVAALVEGRSPSGKELEMLKEIGKPLLIPVAALTCAPERERSTQLRKAKSTVREAMLHRAPVSLASMAGSNECLMSAQQLLAVGGLLGMGRKAAQRALEVMGGAL